MRAKTLLIEGKRENLAMIEPVLDAIIPMGRDPNSVRRDDLAVDLVERYRDKIKNNWVDVVTRASAALTKSDALAWYLRLYLQHIIRARKSILDPAKASKLEQAYFNRVGISIEDDDFDSDSLNKLIHYMSLPIAGIRNYQFRFQSFGKVMSDFQAMEDRWKATVERLVDDDDAKPLIDFGNGWCWMNLGKASCDKEARAMGHCGNSPREDTDDTILSLRKKVQYGDLVRWEPAVTFILTRAGALTEMKGRGNDKPAQKYHAMIVALLLNPIVKSIDGGGYKPENNFSLDDLDEEEKNLIISQKPGLASLWDLYQNQDIPFDEVEARIAKILYSYSPNADIPLYGPPPLITLKEYDSIEEFIKKELRDDGYYNEDMWRIAQGDLNNIFWFEEPTCYEALKAIVDDEGREREVSRFEKELAEKLGVERKDALKALDHLFPNALAGLYEHYKETIKVNARKTVEQNIRSLQMTYRSSRCYVIGNRVAIRVECDTFIRNLSDPIMWALKQVLINDCNWGSTRGYATGYDLSMSYHKFFKQERQRFFDLVLDLLNH